ncbi:MAG: hypothetical protein U0793_09865 [Gemmataceae bacterium]
MNRTWNRAPWRAGIGLGLLAGAILTAPAWAGGTKVKEGDKAPDIDLPATQIGSVFPDKKDAKTLRLSDFKGKKNVVLWFFPKALTGG